MYIYQEKQKTEEKSAFYCASSLLNMFSFARMPRSMSFRVYGQNYNSEYMAILICVQDRANATLKDFPGIWTRSHTYTKMAIYLEKEFWPYTRKLVECGIHTKPNKFKGEELQ